MSNLDTAAMLLLCVLSSTPDAATICLAFYDAARVIARALRSRRCMSNGSIRLSILGAALCIIRADEGARVEVISHGLMAAVTQSLAVRCFRVSADV